MTLVVGGLWLFNQGWGDVTMSTSGFILLCAGSTLVNVRAPRKKMVRHVYSIRSCTACGARELHDFKEGDHVFKQIGPCGKCDTGSLLIEQIFSVQAPRDGRVKMAPAGAVPAPGG